MTDHPTTTTDNLPARLEGWANWSQIGARETPKSRDLHAAAARIRELEAEVLCQQSEKATMLGQLRELEAENERLRRHIDKGTYDAARRDR